MGLALPFSGTTSLGIDQHCSHRRRQHPYHVFNLFSLCRLFKTNYALDTHLKRPLSDKGRQVTVLEHSQLLRQRIKQHDNEFLVLYCFPRPGYMLQAPYNASKFPGCHDLRPNRWPMMFRTCCLGQSFRTHVRGNCFTWSLALTKSANFDLFTHPGVESLSY